jgi:2-dehydro-3-deoxyphosphogluconate aldolase/(4S)-4-hydroxy-2-oxoglutarate aldolase
MLKSLYGPYRHRGVQFVPTGGVSADNLAEYLATPGVVAVGGTWVVAKDILQSRNWDRVTELTAAAVQVASDA